AHLPPGLHRSGALRPRRPGDLRRALGRPGGPGRDLHRAPRQPRVAAPRALRLDGACGGGPERRARPPPPPAARRPPPPARRRGPRRVAPAIAGTLARVPLAGGAPREVLRDVEAAAFAPDGAELAIVRSVNGKDRLEYPIGNVLYESSSGIVRPRFSPDGE